MKNKILLISLLTAILLSSCSPARATILPSPVPATPTQTVIPTPTTATGPSEAPQTQDGKLIEPYQDVRFQNISNINRSLGESLIKTLWFNQSTIWSRQDKPIAESILMLGMNPGLGVRNLHAKGITGKGVTVAIIDQNMVLDHPEFQGKIIEYRDVGTNQPAEKSSMHGPAVTSLLVGEKIGTAPDARVYYAAAPSWTGDAQYYADALNWIIDQNAKLADGDKIRVVSVSAAPSGAGSPFTKNHAAWDAAYKRAMTAGILVLDCTTQNGITAPCYYDLNDPENVAKCIPGWPGVPDFQMPKNRIAIPTSLRTTAEEYDAGIFSYQFTGQGGLSWSVPYLSGVLAMGWQINPNLTGAQLLDMLFASAHVNEDSVRIINPKAFIERVKHTVNE